MNNKSLSRFFVIACAGVLSGCLVPEKFTAKVDVKSDGAYSFSYSGTAVNALVSAQLVQGGKLSDKDRQALDAEAERMRSSKEIRKAVHKGNGRYELEIEQEKAAGKPLSVMDSFWIRTDKAGVMTISSIEIKEKDKREFSRLGLTINGTLEVRVPKDVEVISHNATSTPTWGFGAYTWKIGRIDERPMMKLKFKNLAAEATGPAASDKAGIANQETAATERSSKPAKSRQLF